MRREKINKNIIDGVVNALKVLGHVVERYVKCNIYRVRKLMKTS